MCIASEHHYTTRFECLLVHFIRREASRADWSTAGREAAHEHGRTVDLREATTQPAQTSVNPGGDDAIIPHKIHPPANGNHTGQFGMTELLPRPLSACDDSVVIQKPARAGDGYNPKI